MLLTEGSCLCRPDDDLSSVMQTNAVGPIFMYKYFEPLLEKGHKKILVNTASNFGSLTLASKPLKEKKQRTQLDHTQIVYKVLPCSCMGCVKFFNFKLHVAHAHASGCSLLTAYQNKECSLC